MKDRDIEERERMLKFVEWRDKNTGINSDGEYYLNTWLFADPTYTLEQLYKYYLEDILE